MQSPANNRAGVRPRGTRLGIREEFRELQDARFFDDGGDATVFLRETLARWDARQSTDDAG